MFFNHRGKGGKTQMNQSTLCPLCEKTSVPSVVNYTPLFFPIYLPYFHIS